MPFEDSSVGHTEDHTPTITGATIDTVTYKYGDGSGKFVQASSQYVTYPDSADWHFGTDPFTISVWVNKGVANAITFYLAHETDSTHRLIFSITNTLISIYAMNVTIKFQLQKTITSIADGNWHHIEVGRDSSSGYIFVDGVKQTGITNTYSGDIIDYTGELNFGKYPNSGIYARGNADVLKIDKGICRHTSDFTPPANEDVDNDEYTVLLVKMNPAPIIPFNINIGDAWKVGTPYINIGGSDAWVQVAPKLGVQTTISTLVEYNDKIYGSSAYSGRLYEWNGTDAWVEVAPVHSNMAAGFLVVYNNKIYGSGSSGYLLEWNGVDAWADVAQMLGYAYIYPLIVYNNKIYGGTDAGRLYEWNGTNAWVNKTYPPPNPVAWSIKILFEYDGILYGVDQYSSVFLWDDIHNVWIYINKITGLTTPITGCSVLFNDKIYCSGVSGKLYEWNGIDDWTQIAPQYESESTIYSLALYNNKIYGGTYPGGHLLEWNGTDAWVEVVPKQGNETRILSLVVYHGKLYGGTYPNGNLVEWAGSGGWKPASKLYQSQEGNSTWESVEDETWLTMASETWEYEKRSWRTVI
jgi:hypothetical protein